MRRNHIRSKRRIRLLEHYRNNIVPNMPLPLQLLWIPLGVRQQCRNMKHNLSLLKNLIHRFIPRVPISYVQAPSVPPMILQSYPLPQEIQEILKSGTHFVITKQFLFRCLSVLLVENPKLEVRNKDVLVVVGYELGASGAEDGGEVLHVELVVEQLGHLGRVGGGAQTARGHYLVHGAAGQPEENSGVFLVGHVLGFDGEENRAESFVCSYEVGVFLERKKLPI